MVLSRHLPTTHFHLERIWSSGSSACLGETISSAGGQVVINGKPLKEPWLVKGTVTTGITTQVIPPNEYFVMGDNRSDSQDSRFFGPITPSLIVGKVMLSGCHG